MPVKVAAKTALLALAIGLLGACQVTTGPIYLKSGYRSEFTYAAANRDTLVVISGTPFASARAAVDDAVLAAFRQNFNEFNTRFTTAPSDKVLPPYKMVVVFGVMQPGSESDYCAGTAPAPAAETDGRLTAEAIYCGETPIAFIRSTMAKPAGPNDPAFTQMLNQLTWQMLPADDDSKAKPDYNFDRDPQG